MLVSLGLTDVGAITGRAVAAILPRLGERRLEVALGDGAPSLSVIQALAEADPRVGLHIDTPDMAELVAGADLAIGAGGSSAWERCVLGLPTLTLILADNQRANTTALAAAGAALALEVNGALEARLAGGFARLIGDPARRAKMSEAAAGLCDGRAPTGWRRGCWRCCEVGRLVHQRPVQRLAALEVAGGRAAEDRVQVLGRQAMAGPDRAHVPGVNSSPLRTSATTYSERRWSRLAASASTSS